MALFDGSNLPPRIANTQTILYTLENEVSSQSHCRYWTSPATGEITLLQSRILRLRCSGCSCSLCHNIQPKQQCLGSRRDFIIRIKTTTMIEQYTPSPNNTSEKQHTLNRPSHSLSANLAKQEVNGGRSQSPANIHKALPPVPPFDSSISKPLQSTTTNSSSFSGSQDTTHCSSPTSNVSSAKSRSSKKTEFRIITRDLVNPDIARGNITLSPVQPDMYLNPAKYDPGNPPKSPRT